MRREGDPKPWYRPRNVILLIVLLILALVGYQVRRAVTARPGSSIDYGQKLVDLAASVKPGAGPEENGWDDINAAVERRTKVFQQHQEADPEFTPTALDFSLVYTEFEPADPGASGDPYGTQTTFNGRRALAISLLDEYRAAGVFEALAAATGKSVYIRPKPPEPLLTMAIPELGITRELAKANTARMRLARAPADQPELVAAFEQSLAMARLDSCDPIIISHMVANAITALTLNELREAILDGSLRPETLRALQAALERQGRLQPMSLALEGERISTLDIIQSTHTDDGNGDGSRIVSEWLKLKSDIGFSPASNFTPLVNLSSGLYPSKKQITAKANEYYDILSASARLSHRERLAQGGSGGAGTDPSTLVNALPWNYDLLKLLIPALGRAITSSDEVQVELAGMRLLLAIELFRAEHAKPPATLDELVPSYLPALPVDGYAKDGRFRYRLLTKPDDEGRTYLLYSVGPDGNDDDANELPAGKKLRQMQSTTLQSYDLLINRRRGRQ